MGAFQGSLTFKQYHVLDPLPSDWKVAFQNGIVRHVFRELDPASEVERSTGWCSPHFPLDLALNSEVYLYNEYLILGFRVDVWSIPSSTLKIYCEAEARRVMEEQKRETLPRYERAEIKERVLQDLKRKTVPTIRCVDMVWHWGEGTVRFFATSQKINLEFQDCFENSFGLRLLPDGPMAKALYGRGSLPEAEHANFDSLEPQSFLPNEGGL